MSSKILDLQGIRGIAIFAVLGFHFFPYFFPNGYLGVDQFFVLSGFLMCMLLGKSGNMSILSMITNFYFRRFRRILPLYQLVILLSLIALHYWFPMSAIETNQYSAKTALFFMSNRLNTDREDYFEMLEMAVNIFTHTWSLSVEVKFYLIVPFIYLIPSRNITFPIITVLSMVYFYDLPSNIAFVDVASRIWQFIIGMMSFTLRQTFQSTYTQLSTDDDCEKQHENVSVVRKANGTYTWILILALSIVFYPLEIPATFLRPIVTISTGILLILSSGDNHFLSNRIMVYIGDISYSLYLVHWPIYAYWKMTSHGSIFELNVSLMFSVILSIFIYQIFEKWSTQLSNVTVMFLITVLFLTNLTIINKDSLIPTNATHKFIGVTNNMTLDDAKRLNREWSERDGDNMIQKTCVHTDAAPRWCNQTGLKPSNANKIIIIGNSWASNQGSLIYEECGSKASAMSQGNAYGCEPLYPTLRLQRCYENVTEFQEHVQQFEPDYVFHLTRHISYGEPFDGNFDNDAVYQFMLNQTKILTKYMKKKFYILNAIPRIQSNEVDSIVDNIRNNASLSEIDKKLTDMTFYESARKRYAQLAKDCGPKCEIFDYLEFFYREETQTYRFFDDRGLSYMTTANHLTPYGLELVRSVYTKICEKM